MVQGGRARAARVGDSGRSGRLRARVARTQLQSVHTRHLPHPVPRRPLP